LGLYLLVSAPGFPTSEFIEKLRMRAPLAAIDLSEGHLNTAVERKTRWAVAFRFEFLDLPQAT
jgi:hypothetical protein